MNLHSTIRIQKESADAENPLRCSVCDYIQLASLIMQSVLFHNSLSPTPFDNVPHYANKIVSWVPWCLPDARTK